MPLVQCTDCGRDVSTRARSCPHCGNPSPVRRCNVLCAILTGALVAVFVLAGLGVSRAACMRTKARAAHMRATECCEPATPAPAKAPAAAPAPVPAEKVETPKEY